jgi:uncharacterized DUF497 family protein
VRYTWQEEKNRRNIALHGNASEDAVLVFEGPTLEQVNDRFVYSETRIHAIGLVNGIEITIIYTDRGSDERRIISAWRSEASERRAFWNAIGT